MLPGRQEALIPTLDVSSLVIQSALLYGALVVAMAWCASTQATHPGFRDWIVSAATMAAGTAMLWAYPDGRRAWPAWVLATNVVLVFGADRTYRGMRRFAGEGARVAASEQVAYAVALAAFLWFLHVDYSVPARIAVFSAGMAFATARSMEVAHRLTRGPWRTSAWYLVVIQAIGAAIHLVRGGVALGALVPSEFQLRGGLEAVLVALLCAHGMATIIGLLLLNAHRTQLDLAEARERVLRLEQVIPVCMYCHKVRDDQEAWDGIEGYLARHSNARLSHGICPDCFAKNFPGGTMDPVDSF